MFYHAMPSSMAMQHIDNYSYRYNVIDAGTTAIHLYDSLHHLSRIQFEALDHMGYPFRTVANKAVVSLFWTKIHFLF